MPSRMLPPSALARGFLEEDNSMVASRQGMGKTEVRNQPVGEGRIQVGMTCRQAVAATSPCTGRSKARKNV